MAIRASTTDSFRAQAQAQGSDDGSDGSSPRPFDLDFDLGDEDDISGLPKQHDSAAGPVRRSRRPPSTAERKATHNAVERARRESLNGRFMELATALPTMAHVKRPSKAIIVNKSLEYIYDTRARQDLLAKENEQLRKEINELRARLSMPSLATPAPVAPAPASLTASSLESSYAAYAAAAHSHAQAQAQAQAGSRPITIPARHESFSTGSSGASPRSIGSAPELSPPTSYYTGVPSSGTTASASGAGPSLPASFYNYVPVTGALPPPPAQAAQAPSPTSSATPPPAVTASRSSAAVSQSPAAAASTPQDLFSLWSTQHHAEPNHAGLDLFGAAAQQAIDFSLPLGHSHSHQQHAQVQAQLQDAWRMPFGQIPGVPVGGMGFNGMF